MQRQGQLVDELVRWGHPVAARPQVRALLQKLDASSRTEAVTAAARRGLLVL